MFHGLQLWDLDRLLNDDALPDLRHWPHTMLQSLRAFDQIVHEADKASCRSLLWDPRPAIPKTTPSPLLPPRYRKSTSHVEGRTRRHAPTRWRANETKSCQNRRGFRSLTLSLALCLSPHRKCDLPAQMWKRPT